MKNPASSNPQDTTKSIPPEAEKSVEVVSAYTVSDIHIPKVIRAAIATIFGSVNAQTAATK